MKREPHALAVPGPNVVIPGSTEPAPDSIRGDPSARGAAPPWIAGRARNDSRIIVIPAKAGLQGVQDSGSNALDPRLRGDDGQFDLDDDSSYQRWRSWKLQHRPRSLDDLLVDLRDPRELQPGERTALLDRMVRAGFALYRSPAAGDDGALPRHIGEQLGMRRLDANWLADEDGVSRITVSGASDGHGGFIPYTDRAIGWHTDGYYHPGERRIRGMVLHCVRPAAEGGENALLDHELAYVALRDRSPALVQALMQPDAMVIPAREDDAGVARPAQRGPVFSVDGDGCLHMRYTARTRSIEWKDDAATREAAAQLRELLASSPFVWRVRMAAGMGIVGLNVLHDRQAFRDDPALPRLVLRARFLDRPQPLAEHAWRNG